MLGGEPDGGPLGGPDGVAGRTEEDSGAVLPVDHLHSVGGALCTDCPLVPVAAVAPPRAGLLMRHGHDLSTFRRRASRLAEMVVDVPKSQRARRLHNRHSSRSASERDGLEYTSPFKSPCD
jgi:hypothetical protein